MLHAGYIEASNKEPAVLADALYAMTVKALEFAQAQQQSAGVPSTSQEVISGDGDDGDA